MLFSSILWYSRYFPLIIMVSIVFYDIQMTAWEVIYIYIWVGLCIRNAKSAQYHKDRANVEFRLPQNSATVCFISKESLLMKQTSLVVAEFWGKRNSIYIYIYIYIDHHWLINVDHLLIDCCFSGCMDWVLQYLLYQLFTRPGIIHRFIYFISWSIYCAPNLVLMHNFILSHIFVKSNNKKWKEVHFSSRKHNVSQGLSFSAFVW